MGISDNRLIRDALSELQRRLPPNWTVEWTGEQLRSRATRVVDGYARIVAPDRRTALLAVAARRRLDPRGVLTLAATLDKVYIREPVLVVAPHLSSAARERLREADVAYADLTGNIWLPLSEPGLFVEATGASVNPNREERPARSLRGSKAGRVVRALVDFREPPGVRELAARVGSDAGYVSRVLVLIDRQALIERDARGRIERVDWVRLLRRWAEDAPLASRGRTVEFLEPRGMPAFLERLSGSDLQHAVTGSVAASRLAPIAPPRLAVVYVTSAEESAGQLGLRTAPAGANVLLIEPADEYVLARSTEENGLRYAAPSQVAADLLTSPGRGPAEAEELLTWMSHNEEVWRG